MKPCIKCGKTLPLSEFYRHQQMADGHLNKCKECVKEYARNRPGKQEYEYLRKNLPHRVAAREAYAKTERGRISANKAKRKWSENNLAKKRASEAVNNAVRDGKLEKPKSCAHCKQKNRICGHHEDYSKPLDVVWLCDDCHRNLHAFYETIGRKIPA